MIDCRIASSSTPSSSMSSGVRWATGFVVFFCRTVIGVSFGVRLIELVEIIGLDRLDRPWRSVVEVAGAGGGGDAGLDADAVSGGGSGDLAGAQVADRALAHRQHAAVADAH